MKTIRYIFLLVGFLFFAVVYFGTESKTFKNWFRNVKPTKGIFSSDRSRYSDLYGMCHVNRFKKRKEVSTFIADTCKHEKNTLLYILGDSYIMRFITPRQFCGLSKLVLADWTGSRVKFEKNSGEQPVLIIECTERYARDRFSHILGAKYKIYTPEEKHLIPQPKKIKDDWKDYFLDNNQHIEALLFDISIWTPIKQLKGDINFNFFKRLPDEVIASENRDRLFLSETIGDSLLTSSYAAVSDEEISRMVQIMNDLRTRFMQIGFKEVYFSLIPNPVTFFKKEKGNHLVERIQTNRERNFPVINCLEMASDNPEEFFQKSDTHWSTYGVNLWAKAANDTVNACVNRLH